MKDDVVVIGAGPGGLSAATELARAGVQVRLIDEQPYAGGQVYRASERVARSAETLRKWLGADYAQGLDLIKSARREKDIEWLPGTSVWDINCQDGAIELGLDTGNTSSLLKARHVVLATGAMERPTPFAGWQLPGVMSIGAAQTLFKDSGLLPVDGVVMAGGGPLLYLFANQLLNAGVAIHAILDTARKWPPADAWWPMIGAALGNLPQLTKGLEWRSNIARSGVQHNFAVERIEARGNDSLKAVRFWQNGRVKELIASVLLVHDGVVPNTHLTRAANCDHEWDAPQQCWRPRLNDEGRTSQSRLWVVGDGAGIMGAEAAALQGQAIGRRVASELGAKQPGTPKAMATAGEKRLVRLKRLRRFLDQIYPPADAFSTLQDDTTVCRCEAVSAGEIRGLAKLGCTGPNQARSFTRAGMGPCMGRQCGLSVSRLLAEETGKSMQEVGAFSVRAPVKPITLAQLASLTEQ